MKLTWYHSDSRLDLGLGPYILSLPGITLQTGPKPKDMLVVSSSDARKYRAEFEPVHTYLRSSQHQHRTHAVRNRRGAVGVRVQPSAPSRGARGGSACHRRRHSLIKTVEAVVIVMVAMVAMVVVVVAGRGSASPIIAKVLGAERRCCWFRWPRPDQ